MTRSRKRDMDELNELHRIIKEHEATIKKLKRQIKELSPDESLTIHEEEKVPKKTKKHKEETHCPSCPGGILQSVDLGNRTVSHCRCGYRKTIKHES